MALALGHVFGSRGTAMCKHSHAFSTDALSNYIATVDL